MKYINFAISGWARKVAGELASLNRIAIRAEAEHKHLWGGFLSGFLVGVLFISTLIRDSWWMFGVNILLMVLWSWHYWVTVGNEMTRMSMDKIIEWGEHLKREIEKDSERMEAENSRLTHRLGGGNGNSIH